MLLLFWFVSVWIFVSGLQEECPTPTIVSKPGEVAKEFSKLINDFESEAEKLRQAEEEASKEILLRLAEEENERLEEIRKRNQLIAEKDEELARKIQEEINKVRLCDEINLIDLRLGFE